MIIGVIIADKNEFSPFSDFAFENGAESFTENGRRMLRFQYLSNEIVAIEAGIGKVNAAVAAMRLIERYKAEEIYNIGFSGAVHGLVRGETVAGESCAECDFDLTVLGRKPGEKPDEGDATVCVDKVLVEACRKAGIKVVKLGCGDHFLVDTAEKEKIYGIFGVSAFDMESGAIANTCKFYGVPCLSIRKISDSSPDAAEEYKQMNLSLDEELTHTLISLWKVRFDG